MTPLILTRASFSGLHAHKLTNASARLLAYKHAVKVRTVAYMPGKGRFVGDRLNLWSPGDVTPAEGPYDLIKDWFAGLITVAVERDYLLDRLAFHAKHPDVKIRSGVMLRGLPGTGKNTLIHILGKIYGRRNVRTVGGEALASRFNAELSNHQILAIDEVMRRDGWDIANGLKPLLSEDSIFTEQKGEPRRLSTTPRDIYILSNDEAPLPLEQGDRRFFVPAFASATRDPAFFRALYEALPQEVPAFFAALMSRDVSGFNPNAPPPITESKVELQAAVRPALERQLQEWLADRVGPFAHDVVVPRAVLSELRNAGHGATATEQSVVRALKSLSAESLGQLPPGVGWVGRPRCWCVRNIDLWRDAGPAAWVRHLSQSLTQLGESRSVGDHGVSGGASVFNLASSSLAQGK